MLVMTILGLFWHEKHNQQITGPVNDRGNWQSFWPHVCPCTTSPWVRCTAGISRRCDTCVVQCVRIHAGGYRSGDILAVTSRMGSEGTESQNHSNSVTHQNLEKCLCHAWIICQPQDFLSYDNDYIEFYSVGNTREGFSVSANVSLALNYQWYMPRT